MFAGNYAPRGWAFCDGQVVSVLDCPELFAAIGSLYGGNGTSTFALPDMRGRVPAHRGRGLEHGQHGGSELADLTTAHVPVHEHTSLSTGVSGAPGATVTFQADRHLDTGSSGDAAAFASGANNAHDNMGPYLAVHFIISLSGNANPATVEAPFVGEIRLFAGRQVPTGWKRCDGQDLDPGDYPELYASIGTTYGGDGSRSFTLPDLRDRVAIHAGAGEGLTLRKLGESGGSAAVTLAESQLPWHSHRVVESTASGALLVSDASGNPAWTHAVASGGSQVTLNGEPHNNQQPFLALNYLIATHGNPAD
jgi:microcystin-dependent protein